MSSLNETGNSCSTPRRCRHGSPVGRRWPCDAFAEEALIGEDRPLWVRLRLLLGSPREEGEEDWHLCAPGQMDTQVAK